MATTKEINPYIHTATGFLGDKRETMLQNELLLRPKLGIPRSRARFVESDGYTYGISTASHGNTAAEALRGWPGTGPKPVDVTEKPPERDFTALNRDALHSGLVTAPENFMYRAHHDVFVIPKEAVSLENKFQRLPCTTVYGIPTRPSTPIFDLLEHKYQDRWLQQRHQQDVAEKRAQNKNRSYFRAGRYVKECRGYLTRASLLRTYQNPVEPAPLWHMPRFTQSAKPHLQTFRTTKAKTDAFVNFSNDRISRKSNLGHGVYHSAVN